MRGFDEIAKAVEGIAETTEPNSEVDATATAKEVKEVEEVEEVEEEVEESEE